MRTRFGLVLKIIVAVNLSAGKKKKTRGHSAGLYTPNIVKVT